LELPSACLEQIDETAGRSQRMGNNWSAVERKRNEDLTLDLRNEDRTLWRRQLVHVREACDLALVPDDRLPDHERPRLRRARGRCDRPQNAANSPAQR
jgi:hypothetical protein